MVEIEGRSNALIAPRRGGEGALAAALDERFGLKLPDIGGFVRVEGVMLARTAPHQLMAMRDGPGLFADLEAALGEVAGVFDLSDARTAVRLTGPAARTRMRGLLPTDLRALEPGRCVQTVIAVLTVLVCQVDDAPTYELSCATSYRGSFLHALH